MISVITQIADTIEGPDNYFYLFWTQHLSFSH